MYTVRFFCECILLMTARLGSGKRPPSAILCVTGSQAFSSIKRLKSSVSARGMISEVL